jgi:hypothetical protein
VSPAHRTPNDIANMEAYLEGNPPPLYPLEDWTGAGRPDQDGLCANQTLDALVKCQHRWTVFTQLVLADLEQPVNA